MKRFLPIITTLALALTEHAPAGEESKSPATQPAQPVAGATAFARHVPERLDDIAWENDRIAFRIYGPALQNDPKSTSGSGIDVWAKSVRRLVINDWYASKDYHHDHGAGLDYYDVGRSRGDGGLGVWSGKKLWVSADWASFSILDKGPSECGFEITYAPWNADGRRVWETRTVTLKAGSNLNRIESTMHSDQPGEMVIGIGLKRRDGKGAVLVKEPERGLLSLWQPPEKAGTIGLGVLVDPAMIIGYEQDDLNHLVLIKVQPDRPFVYYAGACWDRGLDFKSADAWTAYLRDFHRE
ncbi:MAG: glycosyl hydrolase family 88 [Phycisphaerales bacterium]|nr:glycosyl hydrolase family 88 [Phycisphaerales bacterium]